MRYSGDLKSRLVWMWNCQKEVGLQMVWILNRIWMGLANRTNSCLFFKNHLKFVTKISRSWMVLFLNDWGYSYSHCKSPTTLKPDHWKIRPSKSPDFKWSKDFWSPLQIRFQFLTLNGHNGQLFLLKITFAKRTTRNSRGNEVCRWSIQLKTQTCKMYFIKSKYSL